MGTDSVVARVPISVSVASSAMAAREYPASSRRPRRSLASSTMRRSSRIAAARPAAGTGALPQVIHPSARIALRREMFTGSSRMVSSTMRSPAGMRTWVSTRAEAVRRA